MQRRSKATDNGVILKRYCLLRLSARDRDREGTTKFMLPAANTKPRITPSFWDRARVPPSWGRTRVPPNWRSIAIEMRLHDLALKSQSCTANRARLPGSYCGLTSRAGTDCSTSWGLGRTTTLPRLQLPSYWHELPPAVLRAQQEIISAMG